MEDKTPILSLENILPNNLRMKTLLSEESLIAIKIQPYLRDIPTSISLP